MFRFKETVKHKRQDITGLNQIKNYEPVKPIKRQDLNRSRVIEFTFLPDDQVLLLGSMDGQYPYWVSVSNVKDTETNTEILNRILFDEFTEFTRTWPILDGMMQHRYRRRFCLRNGEITTPFDYGISSEPGQQAYWGSMMAKAIYRHWHEIRDLCRYRELDGRYLEFLKEYLNLMKTRTSDDVRNYEDKRILMKLINSEDYLFQSEDENIRATYILIREEIDSMYNHYMTIVR